MSSLNLVTLQQFFKKRQYRRYYHFNSYTQHLNNFQFYLFDMHHCAIFRELVPENVLQQYRIQILGWLENKETKMEVYFNIVYL